MKLQKMEFGQKIIREIELFDFTRFSGLDFFKYSGPLCIFHDELWKDAFKIRILPLAAATQGVIIIVCGEKMLLASVIRPFLIYYKIFSSSPRAYFAPIC